MNILKLLFCPNPPFHSFFSNERPWNSIHVSREEQAIIVQIVVFSVPLHDGTINVISDQRQEWAGYGSDYISPNKLLWGWKNGGCLGTTPPTWRFHYFTVNGVNVSPSDKWIEQVFLCWVPSSSRQWCCLFHGFCSIEGSSQSWKCPPIWIRNGWRAIEPSQNSLCL